MTVSKERVRAQIKRAFRVIEGFFFTIKFRYKFCILLLINYKSIKMKTNIFSLLLATLVCGFTFGQDLTNPKGGGVLDIITIIPSDGYSDMIFEGQISGYGTVYVAFKVASINSSKNSGTLDGQGRTILENGTLITTPLKGTWKRMGANVKFYFTDAINLSLIHI